MALQPAMKGDVSRTPVKGAFNDHGLILVCGVVPPCCVYELGHHGFSPLLKNREHRLSMRSADLRPLEKPCRHIPRRVPAAPLAGALLICISAVSTRLPIPTRGSHVPVLCCSSVAPRQFPLTPGMRACCQLLFRAEPQGPNC